MELKQLRAFLAVANSHSFLAAADELYLSRQAVSKTIGNLEEELGVELFIRSQSGAALSSAGNYFFPRAESLVADADRLQSEMQNAKGTFRPKLRLCIASGLYALYAEPLRCFRSEHRAEFSLRLSSALDYDCDSVLVNRKADALVSFTQQKNKITDSVLLTESPLVALVHRDNPLARENSVGASVLNTAPLLIYNGGRMRGLWGSGLLKEDDVISSDLQYLLQLLRRNAGLLILPEMMAENECGDAGGAAVVRLDFPTEKGRVYFSTLLPSYYNEHTLHLLDKLHSVLQTI